MKVQRKVVGCGHEDETVKEAYPDGRNIRPFREQAYWRDRVFGVFPFVEDEQTNREESEYYQADDCGGIPGMCHAAELKAEEKHESSSHYRNRADPIHGFQSIPNGRLRIIKVQEQRKEDENSSCDGH